MAELRKANEMWRGREWVVRGLAILALSGAGLGLASGIAQAEAVGHAASLSVPAFAAGGPVMGSPGGMPGDTGDGGGCAGDCSGGGMPDMPGMPGDSQMPPTAGGGQMPPTAGGGGAQMPPTQGGDSGGWMSQIAALLQMCAQIPQLFASLR